MPDIPASQKIFLAPVSHWAVNTRKKKSKTNMKKGKKRMKNVLLHVGCIFRRPKTARFHWAGILREKEAVDTILGALALFLGWAMCAAALSL